MLKEFTQMVQFNQSRCMHGHPSWKDSHLPLPTSLCWAAIIFRDSCRNWGKPPTSCESTTSSIINTQLRQGVLEQVDQPSHGVSGWLHYLPYHVVLRGDKKTTKLQIMCDALAIPLGAPSMSDCSIAIGWSLIRKFSTVYLQNCSNCGY